MFQYFILELNHEDNYNTSVTHQILFLVGVVIGVIIFFLTIIKTYSPNLKCLNSGAPIYILIGIHFLGHPTFFSLTMNFWYFGDIYI